VLGYLANKKTSSYVVISNDTSHSKFCVWTFLRKIVSDIKENDPLVDKLMIFSDNCAGQFKNKYSMSALGQMEADFSIDIEWNFFASSHGKGAVDGIRGTVKRHVWTAVKGNRNVHIETANDFHKYIVDKVNGVKSFYIDKSEILDNTSFLQIYWQNVLPIPDIQSSHHFRVYDSNHLLVARTSTSLMTKVPVFQDTEEATGSGKQASKTRLRYEDVYSDTDCTSEEDVLPSKKTSSVCCRPIKTQSDVYSGMYVLVEVPSEHVKGRRSTGGKMYRYAAICQGGVDSENYISVMFLRSHGSKEIFIADDEDVKHVSFDNVLGSLPNPSVKPKGLFTILYEFSGDLDVLEK